MSVDNDPFQWPDPSSHGRVYQHWQGMREHELAKTEQYIVEGRARDAADEVRAQEKYAEPIQRLRVRSRRLDEFLAEPDDEQKYIIDQLLPFDGNATLTAPKKTGKTTFSGNLTRSLADGEPFLGAYGIAQPSVVGLWDYEMSERQLREWFRDLGIQNTEGVHVMALRGMTMSFKVGEFAVWAENWLGERGIDTWIIDPGHRAASGFMKSVGDPNEAIMEFTEALDRIKANAGVRNMFVPLHTGLQGEHARGGARWGDWPDAIWSVRKDDNGTRYISAEGRDVDLEEKPLVYDRVTRLLSTDPFDRASSPRIPSHLQTIINWLKGHPDVHPSKNRLGVEMRQIGIKIGNAELSAAVEKGLAENVLHLEIGTNRSQFVWLTPDWDAHMSRTPKRQTPPKQPPDKGEK